MTEIAFDLSEEQYHMIKDRIPKGCTLEKMEVVPDWLKRFFLAKRQPSNSGYQTRRNGDSR